jgi:hypothetical protein
MMIVLLARCSPEEYGCVLKEKTYTCIVDYDEKESNLNDVEWLGRQITVKPCCIAMSECDINETNGDDIMKMLKNKNASYEKRWTPLLQNITVEDEEAHARQRRMQVWCNKADEDTMKKEDELMMSLDKGPPLYDATIATLTFKPYPTLVYPPPDSGSRDRDEKERQETQYGHDTGSSADALKDRMKPWLKLTGKQKRKKKSVLILQVAPLGSTSTYCGRSPPTSHQSPTISLPRAHSLASLPGFTLWQMIPKGQTSSADMLSPELLKSKGTRPSRQRAQQ